MKKVSTFLWLDNSAEQAVGFYSEIFAELKIVGKMAPGGKVIGVTFDLWGQQFIAFNGGSYYKLNPAVSIFVNCDTQEEIDNYWDKLLAGGGKEMACGWLTDKFGVSWQIIPRMLGDVLGSKDSAKSERARQAMMEMVKLDIQKLQAAFDGK